MTVNKIMAPSLRHCSNVTELKLQVPEISFSKLKILTIQSIRRKLDGESFYARWSVVPRSAQRLSAEAIR